MNERSSETTDAQHACGEAYQAVVLLANMAGVFDDPIVQALLDNLSDAADGKPLSHESILPFYPNGWIDKVKQHRPGTPATMTNETAKPRKQRYAVFQTPPGGVTTVVSVHDTKPGADTACERQRAFSRGGMAFSVALVECHEHD